MNLRMPSRRLSDVFEWPGQPQLQELRWKSIAKTFPKLLTTHEGKLYKSDGIVGIEVEVEGIAGVGTVFDPYLHYYWAIANDGSLRNAGREYISAPLQG